MSVDQRKLRALALRFTEGPHNDPLKFPVDLISGPSAFPRLRLEHQAIALTPLMELSINERLDNYRNQLIQSIKSAGNLQAQFMNECQSAEGCDPLRSLVTGLSHIRSGMETVVKYIGDQVEMSKEKLRLDRCKIQRMKFLTMQCYIEHSRALREVERRDLIRVTEEFGLQSFLQPTREPPSVVQLTDSLPEETEMPSIVKDLLSEVKSRSTNKASSQLTQFDATTDKGLKFPPSTNGKFSQHAMAEFAHALLPLEKGTSQQCRVTQKIHDRLRHHSVKAWSTYTTALKRCRRFMDEQASPYRFFPLLRRDQPIRLLNLLGKGGFAEVWEGLHINTWEIKAIKITELHQSVSTEEKELILKSTCREVSLQRSLKHPNVVEMQQCFEITSSIFVACLDLCKEGSLDDIIQQYGPIPEALAKAWIYQVLKALEYIHLEGKVVHFDLKPLNILLSGHDIKIADFGLHQPVNSSEGIATLDMNDQANQVGTVWYMPPEHLEAALMHNRSQFDGKFDLWSAGIVLYEMLFQRRPFGQCQLFHGLNPDHVAALVLRDFFEGRLHFPCGINQISDQCKAFIRRLLQVSDQRPTATEALKDPFFINL